jgi:CubicO group peptidase (beta-lactamase class C family)
MTTIIRVLLGTTLLFGAACSGPSAARDHSSTHVHLRARPITPDYVPPRGPWERRTPAEVGMDPEALQRAVDWALAHEGSMPRDFSTQAQIFGRPLGPVPTSRAGTNGVILRHGYIVAEFGDTSAVDPSYSMAKSYLSTLMGLSVDRGLIPDIDQPVGALVKDGGYDTPHNAKVTWRHHVTQTSEWDGTLFGKTSTFIGVEEFGRAASEPRALREPGSFYEYNDVRINRMSLSLLRLWKRPLPEVLKREIMDPIGASSTWKYIPYDNAMVQVDGRPMPSVSGGTRWGGGLWMNTFDHARFGLMISREGRWGSRQIISKAWLDQATVPQGQNPQYGFLWWLNTTGRWPGAPKSAFAAIGAGENSIWIDREHDLVVVWRWHQGEASAEFYRLILNAINEPSAGARDRAETASPAGSD